MLEGCPGLPIVLGNTFLESKDAPALYELMENGFSFRLLNKRIEDIRGRCESS